MLWFDHNGLRKKVKGGADSNAGSEWTSWFSVNVSPGGYGSQIPNGVNEILVEAGNSTYLCSSAVVYPKESYTANVPVLDSSKNVKGVLSIEVNATTGYITFGHNVIGGMMEVEIPVRVFIR